ncbi:hemin uptake protein HemP [Thiobacillus sp. 63-78]|uniref:hemin uptake protein HemP n=1 Tax=Thiobacillus sp. 63-78 TaxID=1895859 RepID=UPI0025F15D99|nr:hemin uptake protein HemP [Thiobacillus sp. 63-78]
MSHESDAPDPHAMPNAPSSSLRLPAGPGMRTCPTGIVPADFLFQGSQEILISHKGEHYRLRITKNGKLILTK